MYAHNILELSLLMELPRMVSTFMHLTIRNTEVGIGIADMKAEHLEGSRPLQHFHSSIEILRQPS
jgi:hypothetical protein